MDSQVIGGRTLRNRRSLATKKDDDKENEKVPLATRTKTPAKTPRRKKPTQSLSSISDTVKPPITFASLKEDEDSNVAKQEIIDLQEELSLVRKDKTELEGQLKDALEMPISPPIENEVELQELRERLAELERKNEEVVKLATEKELLFEAERQKLQVEKETWKGQFEAYRETENDKLQRLDEENERDQKEKNQKEQDLEKMMEEKEEEIIRLNEENKKLMAQKMEISVEKNTYSEAIESSLESLRCKLSNVEIAKNEATKLADDQKQLARDVMDTYDGKLVDLGEKYKKVKADAQRSTDKAFKYREERDKLREKLERYQKKHDDKEHKRNKTPPRDPRRRGGSDDTDVVKRKEHYSKNSDPSKNSAPTAVIDLTSQYVFQEPFRRVVLKAGESPPEDAVKAKRNACMPIRVAIEPADK